MLRRTCLKAGVLAAQPLRTTLTAADVIARIRQNIGVPWREKTVDGIIAGTPDTHVTGIATTMMSTLDVVQRASAKGLNFVVTHEPTFYSHQDTVDQLQDDATYRYKLDYLRKHNMVCFHLHDHWHARRPDGIAFGMARELGWERYADRDNPRLFTLPSTPLGRMVREIASRLQARSLRVVGDPNLAVTRVIASWGYVSQFPGIPLLARPDIDVLIVGETREWELVEYAQDMIAAGRKKALILVGHVLSEQSGMKYCAEWLKPLVPEVPVEFVPAREPFWIPGAGGAA